MISEEQFQRLLAALTHSTSETDPAKKFDTLAGRIHRRHADIFTVDAKSLDEATRVRLLLHKLDAPSYEKYVNYILPQTPQEVKFDDAISTLKDLFGPQQSLFSTRYTCLKLAKDPKDDFATYAGRVNRECTKFKLAECNENQFKCLIFVCGLQSSEDAFIRLKFLDKIESDPNCTIQILAEECKRLLNLRHDTKMIENGSPAVHSVKQFLSSRQGQQKVNSKTNAQATQPEIPPRLPPSACWFCGEMHFIKDCLIDIINVPAAELSDTKKDTATHTNADPNDSAPPVQMVAQQGRRINCNQYRRYATVKVDDQPINFQVDSASDLTVINKETWQRIGEPELKPPSLIAHSASGDRIQLLGQRQCTYSFHDASAQGTFYVANTPSNLLGAEWIAKMGIYALMDCLPSTDPGQQAEVNSSIADQTNNNVAKQLQRDYPHAFSDKLGLYKMSSATLQLKPGAKPVFRPKRPVPYAAQHVVDKELDRLESIGIISKTAMNIFFVKILISISENIAY
ncbi:retroviral aspartyl protease [Ancylostoma caninum]|uniref:Retroviral aspartyl protease n=1 Tax=Ancylostoma caninum TaxID=29170 RepID=A0A368G8X0_ANCCA|nr:retroviral aspartyl protease [Ancylostoma caninum]